MRFVDGGRGDYREIEKLYGKLYPRSSKSKSPKFNGIRLSSRVLLAKEKNNTVGFIIATFISYAASRFGYIEDLLVDESFRHRGIGTQLVKKALEWEKSKGAKVVFVTTDRAFGFYKKLGFSRPKKNEWLMWMPEREKRNR